MSLTRIACSDCGIPLAYCTCYGRAPHPACDYNTGSSTATVTFTINAQPEIPPPTKKVTGWQQMKERVNRLRR